MRHLTKLLLGLALATTFGACYIDSQPHPYYPYSSRCSYGWYWYRCRHY